MLFMRSLGKAFFIVGLGLETIGIAISQTPPPPDVQLKSFISDTLKWNPAQRGTLIGIDFDAYAKGDEPPHDIADFGRQLIRVGTSWVAAPVETMGVDEDQLPGPYDALDDYAKLCFLLATLGGGDLQRLTSSGISPDELRGQQRAALLSLMPKPFTYVEAVSTGPNGYSSNGESVTLSPSQLGQVKLQLRKGLVIQSAPMKDMDHPGGQMSTSVSSLDYHGPSGTRIVRSGSLLRGFAPVNSLGKAMPAAEQKSDLSWTDPRLAKDIELSSGDTLASAFERVRNQTGIEIYVDKRIVGYELNHFGNQIVARDLIRGLALAVEGAVRKVGPVYILTQSIEGHWSREVRIQAKLKIQNLSIRGEVARWIEEVKQRGLIEKLGFPADDPFGAASIPGDEISDGPLKSDKGWVPISSLPDSLQGLLAQNETEEAARKARNEQISNQIRARTNQPQVPRPNYQPIPEFQGKVQLSTSVGFRFILPDGRPLENQPLQQVYGNEFQSISRNGNATLPLDFSALPTGTAVRLKSEDPVAVTQLCEDCKKYGVAEVWLESQTPSAIQAATNSGLKVDLCIDPWLALKGEACPDPDRNLLGDTIGRLNQELESAFAPAGARPVDDRRSFSPLDPHIKEHFQKLVQTIPVSGLNRLIVVNREPFGYQANLGRYGSGFQISAFTPTGPIDPMVSLRQELPSLFMFGFTSAARAEYIRSHGTDPVDMSSSMRGGALPASPYFETSMRFGRPQPSAFQYPRIRPAQVNAEPWFAGLQTAVQEATKDLFSSLEKLPAPVFAQSAPNPQFPGLNDNFFFAPIGEGGAPNPRAGIAQISFAALTTENSDGLLTYQPYGQFQVATCFDLSQASPRDLPRYLKHLFKLKS